MYCVYHSWPAVSNCTCSVAQACTFTPIFGGQTFNFGSLSGYDIYGVDGSAGSNSDSFYVARICGSVADPVCSSLSGGSMFCKHQFSYNQVPNGGTQGHTYRSII
jgi:hypothetical protein